MQACQKAHPILLTLLRIQQKHGKEYSWPSQLKICELLKRYQGVEKSRTTLNRWMRVVEDSNYLKRKRRIKDDPELGMLFKSTLYRITIKGLRMLSRFGVDVRKEIAAYIAWLKEINPKLSREPDAGVAMQAKPDRLGQILTKLGESFSP